MFTFALKSNGEACSGRKHQSAIFDHSQVIVIQSNCQAKCAAEITGHCYRTLVKLVTSHVRFSSSIVSLSPSPVDELFKEANIKSNGIVKYEEFTQRVMLPAVDY